MQSKKSVQNRKMEKRETEGEIEKDQISEKEKEMETVGYLQNIDR